MQAVDLAWADFHYEGQHLSNHATMHATARHVTGAFEVSGNIHG